MSGYRTGTTAQIRAILATADVPLTTAEIVDALPGVADRDAVSAILSQRRKAGEIVTSIANGKPAYALVTGFEPNRVGSKPGVPKPRASATERAKRAAPPASVEPSTPAPPVAAALPPKRSSSAAASAQSSAPSADCPAPARSSDLLDVLDRQTARPTRPQAFGLMDRLDAIASDIEDAIGDALDAGLDASAVKALVAAGAGLRRATHTLHRSP